MTAKPHPDFTDTAAALDARLARFDAAGRLCARTALPHPSDTPGHIFRISPRRAREPAAHPAGKGLQGRG